MASGRTLTDGNGNLLTVKDALNNATTLTYGTQGELLTITDPRNNTTTFTYDTNGNLTRRADSLNNIAYDARERVTSKTNALNQVTSHEYDLAGRLKKWRRWMLVWSSLDGTVLVETVSD